jgi:hypothetical protein
MIRTGDVSVHHDDAAVASPPRCRQRVADGEQLAVGATHVCHRVAGSLSITHCRSQALDQALADLRGAPVIALGRL